MDKPRADLIDNFAGKVGSLKQGAFYLLTRHAHLSTRDHIFQRT
jgi:hypothetical protein